MADEAQINRENSDGARRRNRRRGGWLVFLFILLAATCWTVWVMEVRKLTHDYVAPAVRGHRPFIADFQFFYEGAQRFLTDPYLLYRVNTRNGFLLIEWDRRIDYGYPPPAVLLFVPFALISLPYGYAAFMVASALLIPICVWLMRLLREWQGSPGRRLRGFGGFALAFSMACGMSYVTLAFGQVNTWVLLICLLYIACVMDGRYILAGLVLGVGFWLKFYPIFLLALAPFEKKSIRLMLASALGIVLVPLALQSILPLVLYQEYFRDVYPGLAGQTSPHVYNQSVVAWLTRFLQPREMFFDWGPLVVDPAIRILSAIFMALGFGVVMWGYHRSRCRPYFHYAAVLAVVPMVVTYGWGGTYLLALPLVLHELREWVEESRWGWLAILPVTGALLIPAYRPYEANWPNIAVLQHLFYNRYFYTVAVMVAMGIWRYDFAFRVPHREKQTTVLAAA